MSVLRKQAKASISEQANSGGNIVKNIARAIVIVLGAVIMFGVFVFFSVHGATTS